MMTTVLFETVVVVPIFLLTCSVAMVLLLDNHIDVLGLPRALNVGNNICLRASEKTRRLHHENALFQVTRIT